MPAPQPSSISDPEVADALRRIQQAARRPAGDPETKNVTVDGRVVRVPFPFPSPADWRDGWIYFLMLDRFDNPAAPPRSGRWDRRFGFRQGGTFEGVRRRLGYLRDLGATALWLTPVLRNPAPDGPGFEFNYHGYQAQDFLHVDPRFGSDGTQAAAERELAALVDEAHARGLSVILDVVLNHAAQVFDYVRGGQAEADFGDPAVMNAPLGQEPPIRWRDGSGRPNPAWQPDLPPPDQLGPDDAVWPSDLQRKEFFRRRGHKLTDDPGASFVRGDFGTMRQLVVEYNAAAPGQDSLRQRYGPAPVLDVLVRAYEYLIARYDVDAFRIDSVKYVSPQMVETFGNAMREFALSAGKRNFFTFGEIYDQEAVVDRFVGRHAGTREGFGIDAALDFPLFFVLPKVVKGQLGVEAVRQVIENRKRGEEGQVSSHGEAGQYFVSFLDNHDQNERFHHPQTPDAQVTQGLALLFGLQGIPCLYYGTEQGLTGTTDDAGGPDLGSMESVREALWGKPGAFDPQNPFYGQVRALAGLRAAEPALRYGRIYPREVSGNGTDFGHSTGVGGVIAFARVVTDREAVVLANTGAGPFAGEVLLDLDLSRGGRVMRLAYTNQGAAGAPVTTRAATIKPASVSGTPADTVATLAVTLRPGEAQVWVPD